MSYLVLPDGMPDFSQAVVSLWFRVPQSTIDAARAAFDRSSVSKRFNGLIPLIVFGPTNLKKKQTHSPAVPTGGGYTIHYMTYNADCTYHEVSTEAVTFRSPQFSFNGTELDIDPSYIAIDCTENDKAVLSVNIQMPDHATLDGSWEHEVQTISPGDIYKRGHPVPYTGCTVPPTKPNGGFVPTNSVTFEHIMGSGADKVLGGRPEVFRLVPLRDEISFGETGVDYDNAQTVTPDHWHHLLLSFDLSLPCTTEGVLATSGPPADTQGSRTTSACKMWIAFDDVNLTEKKLSTYWPGGYSDPNAILTVNAYFQASNRSGTATRTFDDDRGNLITDVYSGSRAPSCNYQPGPIATANHAIGLPSTNSYVEGIRMVEMAELQIFTGATLETGTVANRRAFVDKDGKPVIPSVTQQKLGQKPQILLHGTNNWKSGRNTGSLGLDIQGRPIKAGQFQRQGIINQYKPDPSLHGPQDPPKPAPVQLTGAMADAGL